MKRLLVFCDGTWQDLETEYPTNVVKLMQAVRPADDDGVPQIVFYDEGVGTLDEADKVVGGTFGWRLGRNIREAYRFLCLNFEPGDQIYLFGYSRGAYTARSLGGLIANAGGLLDRAHIRWIPDVYRRYRHHEEPDEEKREAIRSATRPTDIQFLGCWDTVGALGVPDKIPFFPLDDIVNRKYQFHDVNLSPLICYARHAVSIDERRAEFDVTPMRREGDSQTDLRQVWFAGDHGGVGGGSDRKAPLADITLEWMIEELRALPKPLALDPSRIPTGIKPDPTIRYPSRSSILYGKIWRRVDGAYEDLHSTVLERWRRCSWWRPKSLRAAHGERLDELEPSGLRTLAVGQAASFAALAENRHNPSGILLEKGASYEIIVAPGDTWSDGKIECGPTGWRPETAPLSWMERLLVKQFEDQRIVCEADWFELIGEIAHGESAKEIFRIGAGFSLAAPYEAPVSGELGAFANDLEWRFANNDGALYIKVKRVG